MRKPFISSQKLIILLTILVLVIVCGLFTSNKVNADENDSDIDNITAKVLEDIEITLSNSANSSRLLDDDIYTKIKFNEKTTINIKSNSLIHGIYLVFDGKLKGYNLNYDEYAISVGVDGFLHDYKKLYTPVLELDIEVSSGGVLTDIYVFGEGNTPDWVQVWEKPLTKADLLVLPTHADDEILFFGGTMPVYASEKGMSVQVAYMNAHWGEPYRPHEALNGLWASGIRNYPIIPDYKDIKFLDLQSALNFYGEDELVEYYTTLIRRFKPEVIVGHDFGGEYGHGSHMASAYALSKALELSNSSENFPASANTYGLWDVKKTYIHLYEENKIVMEWDEPLETFGGKTGFEVAKTALDFHVSQIIYYEMSKRGVYDCRQFGLYRSKVGEDVLKNDFFENIPQKVETVNLELRQEVSVPQSELGLNSNANGDEYSKVENPCFSDCESDSDGIPMNVIMVLAIVLLIISASIIVFISIKNRR